MSRFTIVATAALLLTPSSRALAAPVQIDFNVAGFGPTDEAHQTFTNSGIGLPSLSSITFQSLDSFLTPEGHLHWDANDGAGYADGFGIRDFPSLFSGNGEVPLLRSFSQDEIEANERLQLVFNAAVSLLGFNVTDFFFENEGFLTGLPPCVPLDPDCYRERGEYSIDGGLTWTGFLADPTEIRFSSNGTLFVPVGQTASSLLLRAPGPLEVGGFRYRQLHDFSLAGIRIDEPCPGGPGCTREVTPEPSSIILLGLGLAGLGRRLRRKR